MTDRPLLVGRKVRLRTPAVDGPEHRLIVAWRNDPWNGRWFLSQEPFTLASHLAWYRHCLADESQRYFVVDALAGPAPPHEPLREPLPIGTIGLSAIDRLAGSAERGRQLIGRPEFRGRGFGSEMGYLVLAHAFEDLALERVWAEIMADNHVMLHIEAATGFVRRGKPRSVTLKDGRRVELLRFELTAAEFRRRQPAMLRKLGLDERGRRPAVGTT